MTSSLTTGILVLASLPSLSTPQFLAPTIISAANAASSRLRIVLFSQLFDPDAISHTQSWDNVQRLLTYVYVQATKIAQDKDNPLLQIDVLLKGLNAQEALPENIGEGCELVYRVSGGIKHSYLLPFLAYTRYHRRDSSSPSFCPARALPPLQVNVPSMLPVVALGGTFDHLHAGHKILLSMAAWITSRKLIVGVTDDTLLKSKSNAHVLESLDTRRNNVREFLELFKPGLEYDIVTINDVYGPTGWDLDIQGLVVSRETINGAEMISTHREKEQLPKLSVFIIDVISHTSSNITEDDLSLMRQTKMSSTHIRNWIAMHEKQHYQPQNQQVDGESKPVERGQVGWISSQDA
ncbi:hypothetical protein C8R41DRAFT_940149 [Lentinula lateritia]|uniref:Cytidyltransferase-like domain-containing protein n=1 Tax=Lentinula lateritia TaxID=40482 RepID=A0ABQ8VNP5_9AGAR|nr:hypothetical protein C8R41DRAFT_940149 [Lentinula lateritia]